MWFRTAHRTGEPGNHHGPDERVGHDDEVALGTAAESVPRPIRERDLRGTGWWLLERITGTGTVDQRAASAGATLLRVLAALGPERTSEEAALAEVELRGRIMHGQAPRTTAEWERAGRVFTNDAIGEFHRWDLGDCLLEGDGVGEDDPLVGWQAADDDVEMAVVERDEQGR